jgi:hypothetical protein
MSKEIDNPIEQVLQETHDSCPKCGNPLIFITENGITVQKCVTESFDVATQQTIPCGYQKIVTSFA